MRVALVGCGWFALRAHLPALQKLERVSEQALGFRVSLYALCSRSPDNIQKAVKRLDKDKRTQVKTFLSLEDVLTDQLVDVIDLVLPIAVMPDAIQRCLMAGKSVLSEKPIAPSPEVLGRLWACYLSHAPARQPCARCWCVLENWAVKPTVLHIQRLLQSGVIGEVTRYTCKLSLGVPPPHEQGWRGGAEAGYERAEQVAYEGGWSLDVGVHAVRALRVWFGAVADVLTRDDECDHGDGLERQGMGNEDWKHEMHGWLVHESGLQGLVRFLFFAEDGRRCRGAGPGDRAGVEESAVEHGVTIRGSHGCLTWDMRDNSVCVCRNAKASADQRGLGGSGECIQDTGNQGSERIVVAGDGWVARGVQVVL